MATDPGFYDAPTGTYRTMPVCHRCKGSQRLVIFPLGVHEEVDCPCVLDRPTDPRMEIPTFRPGMTPPPIDVDFDAGITMEIPPSSKVPDDLFVWITDIDGVEHCVRAESFEE
jgi:hypothetical protein